MCLRVVCACYVCVDVDAGVLVSVGEAASCVCVRVCVYVCVYVYVWEHV